MFIFHLYTCIVPTTCLSVPWQIALFNGIILKVQNDKIINGEESNKCKA